jgi:molybdopterin/thiamine biosynthesis adenylyltransferase
MRTIIRISEVLTADIKADLARKHAFAFERIGFAIGKAKAIDKDTELICITEYFPVKDQDYLHDSSVGARINANAIREAMQLAMDRKCSIFHVHMHEGANTPEFSYTDLKELPGIVGAMLNANPDATHGALLLSTNGINAFLRQNGIIEIINPARVSIVGFPISFNASSYENTTFDEERFDRQSFLGKWAQHILSSVRVGIVGLGGGGSHIVQQLAHLGILNFVIFDDDIVTKTNLNRLVGATLEDVKLKRNKTFIAERLIKSLHPHADVICRGKWQEHADDLKICDLVFGCVDSFAGRRDLESETRRYLIPYIDIGMDVRIIEPDPPRMYGQVILSMPGYACMHCSKFLTEKNLAEEASRYGDAGTKPQVIWANGVLASTAVGISIDLLVGWTGSKDPLIYQQFDGNSSTIIRAYSLDYLNSFCEHYPISEAGPSIWR